MDRVAFFRNLEGHFKSDWTQFWDAVVDAKHPRHKKALSGVKASRARVMNEAESQKKEVTQGTFTTKKAKTLLADAESASVLKLDYGLAVRTALQIVEQELATKEVEKWVRSEIENTELREKLDILEKTAKEKDNQEPKKRGLKLNVIVGKTFGRTREGTKIPSIKSVTSYQVVENLTEPSEITLVHLVIYKDYLRKKQFGF